ncbi:MAG: ATP-dependent Clp protease ATP-binding subunit, partial [Clostridia bacterium]|nr:ATP-dependent Clp protease ATP-binding subunit [Clostridia bacterium]
MKLCFKCKKRPAVVFLSDASHPEDEPHGLCLVCAKEMGIKPVDDMLKRMNITDEDIEQMSNQLMELMNPDDDDSAMNDETFDLGTAPAMPFLNNILNAFGGGSKSDGEAKGEEPTEKKDKPKKKRQRNLDQFCTNMTRRAKHGELFRILRHTT